MREKLEKAAEQIIAKEGLINLTAKAICNKCQIPAGSFAYHMKCGFSVFFSKMLEAGKIGPLTKRKVPRVFSIELHSKYILTCAIAVAKKAGFYNLRRRTVAKQANMSEALLTRHFKMQDLRQQIVEHAIADRDLELLADIATEQNTGYKVSKEILKKIKVANC